MPNNVRIGVGVKDDASPAFDRIRAKSQGFKKDAEQGFGLGTGAMVAKKGFDLLDMAASKAVSVVFDSIQAASDLNETVSKGEVIFGKNADAVETWADTADVAFGQSKKAAIDAASGFAGLFQVVGVGLDKSTEMSKKLTELGSDLASFFNTDVDEALAALKSGLNGESEPLRKFNVFLSETAVTAKLAEMGVKKVGGQFTEQQKATARYALILQQTTKAQGDFARTADGQANSSRQVAAEMENLQAEIGQELLPVMRDLTKWARDEGVPALKLLFETVKVLGGAFGQTTPEVTAFREEAQKTGLYWQITGQRLVDVSDAAESLRKPFKSLTGDLGRNREAAEDAASAHSEYAIKTRIARNASDRLADKVSDLVGDFKDLNKWAENAGDTLAESAYGPEELRLKFEGTRQELRHDEVALADVTHKIQDLHKKGKKVPTDLKDRFQDLKEKVNDGKQEVIRLGTKLEATGAISMADLRKQFSLLGIKMNGLTGDAKTLWYYMNLISNTDLGTAFDNAGRGKGKAIGGPVQSGETYLVGEKGPELFSPSMSGYIIPNNQLQGGGSQAMASGWGAGGVTINGPLFTVSTPILTPGATEALAAVILPGVIKGLQRQQLIPRR